MSMVTEYLKYMKDVLGIRQVLLQPEVAIVEDESVEAAKSLLVLFVDQKKWSTAATDLFQKMREAMKLSEEQTAVLYADEVGVSGIQIKALQAQQIVVFDAALFESLQSEFGALMTLTIGPEVLLQNAAQKKVAWSHLQQVMQRLKT